ncbi:MAG TPA: hypothetical protein VFV81_09170 [Verrucomicrobiae bacterium]|nr:hypothetical protein [Verrucomicrobiae bacterium]
MALENRFAEAGRTATTNAPVADWWKTFQDPELEKLVSDAVSNNLNLQMATVGCGNRDFSGT